MTIPTANVLDHTARAHCLRRWEVALGWMGSSLAVVAATLLVFGTLLRAVLALVLFYALVWVREACGRAADRHADWLREDAREHHATYARGER